MIGRIGKAKAVAADCADGRGSGKRQNRPLMNTDDTDRSRGDRESKTLPLMNTDDTDRSRGDRGDRVVQVLSSIARDLTWVPNREIDDESGAVYQKNFFRVSAGLVVCTAVDSK